MKTIQQNYIASLIKIPRVKKIFDKELARVPHNQLDDLRAELKSKLAEQAREEMVSHLTPNTNIYLSEKHIPELLEFRCIVDGSKAYNYVTSPTLQL